MKGISPAIKGIVLMFALFVAIQGNAQIQQSSRSISLLIDASGSMQGLKMDSVKSAA